MFSKKGESEFIRVQSIILKSQYIFKLMQFQMSYGYAWNHFFKLTEAHKLT